MAWIIAALSALSTFVALVAWHAILTLRQAGSFRCKIRVSAGWLTGFKTIWPRRVTRAMWAHDVLIVFRGRVSREVQGLPVAYAHGDVHVLPKRDVSRLGPNPVALDLVLDEGPRLEVAAPAKARALLCGPYIVPQVQPNRGSQSTR